MLIPANEPLHVSSTLESGQTFRWCRWEVPDGTGGDPWFEGVVFENVVRLRRRPEGIEFTCEPGSEDSVSGLLRSYLRLDDDLDAIYRTLSVDERVSAAVERYRGLRIARQDPWECLVTFICSANSNIPRIAANVRDMASAFGRPLNTGVDEHHAFPTADALADAGETALRGLGLGFRAKYVASVADIVARGDIDLFALREAPYDAALEALVALPGVGDKVANCVMLFSLDKLDAFPVDVWIHRALVDWYPDEVVNGKPLPKSAMRSWAQERFRPYAGYANQYLFHDRRRQGRKSE